MVIRERECVDLGLHNGSMTEATRVGLPWKALSFCTTMIGSGFDSLNCCSPRCFDEVPIPGYFECRVNLLGLTMSRLHRLLKKLVRRDGGGGVKTGVAAGPRRPSRHASFGVRVY